MCVNHLNYFLEASVDPIKVHSIEITPNAPPVLFVQFGSDDGKQTAVLYYCCPIKINVRACAHVNFYRTAIVLYVLPPKA